jgi:hypothetical protein
VDQFVDDNVVDEPHGRLHDAPVEADRAAIIARGPAALLIPDHDTGLVDAGAPGPRCNALREPKRSVLPIQRGLYCTKDTFVTTAFAVGVKIPWLEAQTGVAYETLRKHYGKWVPLQIESELRRFEKHEPGLFGGKLLPKFRPPDLAEYVGRMRGGGLEPPRVLPH